MEVRNKKAASQRGKTMQKQLLWLLWVSEDSVVQRFVSFHSDFSKLLLHIDLNLHGSRRRANIGKGMQKVGQTSRKRERGGSI
jgi:hypothetical protein